MSKAKPLNVKNLLNAMETLRQMMGQEEKPLILSGKVKLDADKSAENWRMTKASK